jgi:FG-GAP repeat
VESGSNWHGVSAADAELLPVGSTDDDDFGRALAVSSSGNLIAVGAPNRGQGQGAVYVYQLSAPAWEGHVSQSATLSGPAGTVGRAGGAVAVSGTTVLAGAPFATLDNMPQAGAGYVYAEPASGWQNTSTPDATLSASDPGIGAGAGSSVAMSNGIAVLGAPNATVNGAGDQGALYVFGTQPVTTSGGGGGGSAATKTTTASFGDQSITLTTPSACVAAGGKLPVTLNSKSVAHKKPKLKFKLAQFYIDKGRKHTTRVKKTHKVHGKTVVVKKHGKPVFVNKTVYLPNATARHVIAHESLSIAGLRPGTHTLRVKISYNKTVREHGKKHTKIVTKTLKLTFTIC